MKIKKWNGSAWVQDYPEVNVSSIVATGTPSSSTFLRGDGQWSNSIANNFLPSTDSTYTLGSGSFAWSEVFTDALTLNNELTIGSQIFYAQGTNGFSVNEDYDPSNTSTQTAYHFTSGSGRNELAFTLARTASFTNGFGIYGDSSDNKFVSFGEQSNTSWEWRTGVGIRPLDLDGGTLRMSLSSAGTLNLPNHNGSTTGLSLGGTVVTATAAELNYVDGVTSNIQTQLNAKAADTDVVKLAGTQTITGYKYFGAGAGIGNSSGTTSDSITFDTAQQYTGPQIRGIGTTLYRGYYLSNYEIADSQNYASVIPGSFTPLYTGGPTLVTSNTATWTDFALGYTPSTTDKFLVIVSVGSNSSSIEKAGIIVEYGTFSSTNGMSLIGFMGYGGVSSNAVIGVNYACQWQISSSNFRLRYPSSSAWNSTTISQVTTFYVWDIYKVN